MFIIVKCMYIRYLLYSKVCVLYMLNVQWFFIPAQKCGRNMFPKTKNFCTKISFIKNLILHYNKCCAQHLGVFVKNFQQDNKQHGKVLPKCYCSHFRRKKLCHWRQEKLCAKFIVLGFSWIIKIFPNFEDERFFFVLFIPGQTL